VDEYTKVTVPLVSNGRVTLPTLVLEGIGAKTGDLLEIQFKVVKKAPEVVIDDKAN
jgi:bifunctional DNA-binding transcriptional regulator/antitoxin component of YhaV-PrlF toxin-antitoxin module